MRDDMESPKEEQGMSLLGALEQYICPQFFAYQKLYRDFDEHSSSYQRSFQANNLTGKVSNKLKRFRDRVQSQSQNLAANQAIRVQELSKSLAAAQKQVNRLQTQLITIKTALAKEKLDHKALRFGPFKFQKFSIIGLDMSENLVKKHRALKHDKKKEINKAKREVQAHTDKIFIEAVLSVALVRKIGILLHNSHLPGEKQLEDWINVETATYLKPFCPVDGSAMPTAQRLLRERVTKCLETEDHSTPDAPAQVRNIFHAKDALEELLKVHDASTMAGKAFYVCFLCKVVRDVVSDLVTHYVENCGKCLTNGHDVSAYPAQVRLGICGACNQGAILDGADIERSRSTGTQRKSSNRAKKHNKEDHISLRPKQVETPASEGQITLPTAREDPSAATPEPKSTPDPPASRWQPPLQPAFDPLAFCTYSMCNKVGHYKHDCVLFDTVCQYCWKPLRPFEGTMAEAEIRAHENEDLCIGIHEFCRPYIFDEPEIAGESLVGQEDKVKDKGKAEHMAKVTDNNEDKELDQYMDEIEDNNQEKNKDQRMDEAMDNTEALEKDVHMDTDEYQEILEKDQLIAQDAKKDAENRIEEQMDEDEDSDDDIKMWDGTNFVPIFLR